MSEELAPLNYALISDLQAKVAHQLTVAAQLREARGEAQLSAEYEEQQALAVIDQVVADHLQQALRDAVDGDEVPTDRHYDDRLATAVYAAMFGAGELDELLTDERVENIDINGFDEVWVTYAGASLEDRLPRRHRPFAPSNEDLVALIQNLAAHAGINPRPWTPATPELDLRLKDGSRLSAVMVAGESPSISIRRNRFPQMFLREVPPAAAAEFRTAGKPVPPTLLELETVDEELASFLGAAVRSRMNLIVCGATDSGKTTTLRALINIILPAERLITVEKAAELGLRRHPGLHPNVVEWELVLPDVEGRGGLSMAQLVQRSLRQNPSRVIVGEVLGEEIVTMLNAMSQGNDGSLSTLHARSALGALERIATYAAQAEHLPFDVTHSLIAGAIDFIVFVHKNPLMGGIRTVAEVREVGGFDHINGRVVDNAMFLPSPVTGRAERTDSGITAERLKRLEDAGYTDRELGL